MSAQDQVNLQMFVLDVMQDDIEDLSSIMLHLGQWRRDWPRDFTEPEIIVALRTLLEKGWISTLELGVNRDGRQVLFEVEVARTSEEAIRSYSFLPTQSGQDTWQAWEPPLPTDA